MSMVSGVFQVPNKSSNKYASSIFYCPFICDVFDSSEGSGVMA
jgi:hypothetical protein